MALSLRDIPFFTLIILLHYVFLTYSFAYKYMFPFKCFCTYGYNSFSPHILSSLKAVAPSKIPLINQFFLVLDMWLSFVCIKKLLCDLFDSLQREGSSIIWIKFHVMTKKHIHHIFSIPYKAKNTSRYTWENSYCLHSPCGSIILTLFVTSNKLNTSINFFFNPW